MDMDTHAEDLNTTVTATCTSEIMDTVHQLHAETASTCTTMDTVVTVMTTAVDMVTWIVEAICTLTVEPLLKVQATSMYTAHATVMDMDTHAEDLNTTVTATCTSEIMDTVHQLHAETASTCTTMD